MQSVSPVSRRRLAFGASVLGFASLFKVGLQFAMLPIMARLLGPSEFGLYALALPTVTFLQMLADGGFGNSLAREPESSTITWSTAFWILHGFCAGLAILVIGWSFLLAGWTHQPRLPLMMAVLSLSLLFLAASILPGARLTRRGEIGKGAAADVVANCVGAAAGVVLAFDKAGAWSLVAQYIVTYATRTFLLNLAAFELPTFQFDLGVLTGHFAVGGALVGSKLADFIGRMVENAVLSRGLGASALGAYSFGNQIPRFLCEAVSNPVWATLYVQALRSDRHTALQMYYRVTRLLGLVLLPMAALGAVAAPTVITILLGASWVRSAPVIMALLPTFALFAVSAQSNALLFAYGRSDIWLWITSANAIGRVLAVGLGLFVGLSGVGILVGFVCVAAGVASIFAPAHAIGADPWRVARSLAPAIVVAAASGITYLLLLHIQAISILSIIIAMMFAVILGIVMAVVIERSALSEDFQTLKSLLS